MPAFFCLFFSECCWPALTASTVELAELLLLLLLLLPSFLISRKLQLNKAFYSDTFQVILASLQVTKSRGKRQKEGRRRKTRGKNYVLFRWIRIFRNQLCWCCHSLVTQAGILELIGHQVFVIIKYHRKGRLHFSTPYHLASRNLRLFDPNHTFEI